MHRFYSPPQQVQGSTLFLTGAEAHHGLHVLRLRRGENVTVLDGAGREFSCTVEASDRDKIKLTVVKERPAPEPACRVTLLVAIPKGKIIESVIQKATELGAFRIVPLVTERVVTKLDDKEAARKNIKWQQIAIEAIKQCGAPWLPRVDSPQTLQAFLAKKEFFELPLLASLQAGSKHPTHYFESFRTEHKRPPRSVCVWIGPEGDLTESESEMIRAAGALPITLGPLVLRVETAAVYCLSLVRYETGRHESPALL